MRTGDQTGEDEMIHLGDITKIRGDEIPPVDCITGGSPCQDLSVAGKRAGLEGERSGLFMEQIRIVKEMRERDRRAGRTAWAVRPRFMVWENVPGAFSSNGGKDFQAVLTEIVKIVEPDAPDVPLPDKGKWPKAGCLYSDVGDWSVAWRVHDAQFWGVPQRRKRIALVADFGGLAAPEILFERESLSRDPEPRGAEREGTAAAAQGGAGEPSAIPFEGNGTRESHRGRGYGEPGGASFTLNGTEQHGVALSFQERAGKPGGARASSFSVNAQERCQPSTTNPCIQSEQTAYGISAYESNSMKSSNPHSGVYEADTSRTLDLNGGSPACNQGGVAILQCANPHDSQSERVYYGDGAWHSLSSNSSGGQSRDAF